MDKNKDKKIIPEEQKDVLKKDEAIHKIINAKEFGKIENSPADGDAAAIGEGNIPIGFSESEAEDFYKDVPEVCE